MKSNCFGAFYTEQETRVFSKIMSSNQTMFTLAQKQWYTFNTYRHATVKMKRNSTRYGYYLRARMAQPIILSRVPDKLL